MSIITGAKLRSMQHFHETNIFNTELEKHGMQPCQDKALLTNIENFHVNIFICNSSPSVASDGNQCNFMFFIIMSSLNISKFEKAVVLTL